MLIESAEGVRSAYTSNSAPEGQREANHDMTDLVLEQTVEQLELPINETAAKEE